MRHTSPLKVKREKKNMSNPIVKIHEPAPSAAQRRWQDMEYSGFVHFNMSTFVAEGGHAQPNQDPSVFNPIDLDCRQWADAAKNAGMRMLVLTAKHHDGFCLWPSAQTDYCVKSSAWRKGKGDVVRDCADACADYGLAFGLYLSPWDKQHDSAAPAYADFYDAQLRELLGGHYGPIALMWLDGCGAKNIADSSYEKWIRTARQLQPETIFRRGWGPDGRWGGKESAEVGYPQWAMLNPAKAAQLRMDEGNLVQDYVKHGDPEGACWIPAEADPPSYKQHHWFWCPEAQCPDNGPFDGFETTVWSNAVLNRGLEPDRRGLIPDDVVIYLRRCRKNREHFLASSLEMRDATASDTRDDCAVFAAHQALQPGDETFWAPHEGIMEAEWKADIVAPGEIALVMLREPIAYGQRVRRFSIDLEADGSWLRVFQGLSIGRKQLCGFKPRRAAKIRIRISEAAACPLLAQVAAFGGLNPGKTTNPVLNHA